MPPKDELKRLINQRGNINNQLNRFKTYLGSSDNHNEVIPLQTRLEKIELLWDEFNTVQSKIEPLEEEPELDERALFEEAYYDAVGIAKTIISKLLKGVQDLPTSLSSDNGNTMLGNIKLPTLNLPIFSGAYEQWLAFHDTFNSLIHLNPTLSEIQKFHYLQASLKSEAAQVINALQVSAANYNVAWSLLKERFQNKRVIVHNHVKALFDLTPLTKESSGALRQLLDNVLKHLRALQSLGKPTEHWDTIIIYLISIKLDTTTKREWESSVINNDSPTMGDFTKFLTNRCQLLETLDINKVTSKPTPSQDNTRHHHHSKRSERTTAHIATRGRTCEFCKGSHTIYKCEVFLKLPVSSRLEEVGRLNLCTICLRQKNHSPEECKSGPCRVCNKKHNTLVHADEELRNTAQQSSTVVTHCFHKQQEHILLSTALVYAYDKNGGAKECRVLLDSGSQSNFITKELSDLLQLSPRKIHMPVTGINQAVTTINQQAEVRIKSRYNSYSKTITCLILPKITEELPTIFVKIEAVNIPNKLNLADPTFHQPGKIDMLLGAGTFWELLCVGQIKLSRNQPILQKTHFGWIVSGALQQGRQSDNKPTVCHLNINERLNEQVTRFWKIEDCNTTSSQSEEEIACEHHFKATVKRTKNGRFMVALPMRENTKMLGESRQLALKRLYAIERKLERQPALKQEYASFMQEYQQLGHMTMLDTTNELEPTNTYYIPHHAVLKPSSTTTKLRVVFDASTKSTSGMSFNDKLMVGPTIQDDLFSIVARFRTHQYAFIADIAKMYRQVTVREEDRHMQRILWRSHIDAPVECYTLNTVTYGTASAPFLAVRCLHQLATDNQSKFPRACNIIQRDFYVDDLVTGTNSLEEGLLIKQQLVKILHTGGFDLRKFASNNPQLGSEESNTQSNPSIFQIMDSDEAIKALGLQWNTNLDIFQYTVKTNHSNPKITKRTILSIIAQIFDPLGLLGPIMVTAKIILQKVWQIQLGWDESLPTDLHTTWLQFYDQLQDIERFEIPRHVVCPHATEIQIHGFCDSSELAYGACVYIRSTNYAVEHHVKLLCAKSRVAPLKMITLPRLELSGALLLAQLTHKVKEALNCTKEKTFYWSDSTIALAWISAHPGRWKPFVAHRVAEIQRLTQPNQWRHVISKENPADIISRGTTPSNLIQNYLWWNGPHWLKQEPDSWPEVKQAEPVTVPEIRATVASYASSVNFTVKLFDKYSSLTTLQRVTAYVLRFRDNLKRSAELRDTGSLTTAELRRSLDCLLKLAQAEEFAEEIKTLKQGEGVKSTSRLITLNPFLDKGGLIRVGGRLRNATIPYSQKHPVVLAPKHQLTALLIRYEHLKLLHAGQQAVLTSLRNEFWPLSARTTVKGVLRKCVRCFRARPLGSIQLMGDLPDAWVTPMRPFLKCGLDYAGPFYVKEGKYRSRKTVKAYLCIFVCFSTKAVHLELVSDLTSQSFISALKRFISRRGKCTDIYSDNATNFIGANNELKELLNLLKTNHDEISKFLSQDLITWHFSPPRAPHFGGLWEAAVKSAKYHLKRVVGNASLTFESLYTIFTQIEACMNSRPLMPLSNDPHDLNPLTPGHFIIGDALTALPHPDLQHLQPTRLSQHQRLQQIIQHFWTRWSKEYLGQLQQRSKWTTDQTTSLEPGRMVVVKEDNLPPLKWQLGRIVKLYPGKDNICRVVDIKTSTGTVKRAVAKVCVLPIE